jgi:hypothetical protein
MGVSFAYFRTWWGNLTATVNTAVTPADFDQFCIAAPGDSRLGDASASQICGLYDTVPAKFGQVNRRIVLAKDLGFGTPQEVYNGIETSVNARWGRGALVSGGLSLGRETLDFCYANGHPELTPESFPTAPVGVNYPRSAADCERHADQCASGSGPRTESLRRPEWDVHAGDASRGQRGKRRVRQLAPARPAVD